MKHQLLELLDQYARAYKEKDLEGVLKLFVEDDDLVVIGTEYYEWVNSKSELFSGINREL